MALCCPPGHGCNAPGGGEPCALALCREAARDEEDAALALARWDAFEAASGQESGDGKRRFRRRAFERARDKALIALAMHRGEGRLAVTRSERGLAMNRSGRGRRPLAA